MIEALLDVLEVLTRLVATVGPLGLAMFLFAWLLNRVDGWVRDWLRLREREADASDRTARMLERDSDRDYAESTGRHRGQPPAEREVEQ